MTIDREWKDRIVAAGALDAVKVPHSERVMPPFTLPQIGVPFAPRALRTDLIDKLEADPDSVDPAEVGPQLLAADRGGGGHLLLPFAGQSVALIHDIAPAGQLIAHRRGHRRAQPGQPSRWARLTVISCVGEPSDNNQWGAALLE